MSCDVGKRWKGWRMSCDVGEVRESLEHEQPFLHFTYVTAHSPTVPSLYLRHSSFYNPSIASLTSKLILQPFFRFSYVTGSSFTSSGEPPMERVKVCCAKGNVRVNAIRWQVFYSVYEVRTVYKWVFWGRDKRNLSCGHWPQSRVCLTSIYHLSHIVSMVR